MATVVAAIGACGGGGPTTSDPVIQIQKTAIASGDGQSATVGSVLPQAIRVLVTADGNPKSGSTITWTPRSGTVASPTSVTNDSGIATTTWTIGTGSGPDTLFGSLSLALGSPQAWVATGLPGGVKHLSQGSGAGQITAINTSFVQALTVALTDTFGNPVPGVTVSWALQSGDATISEPGAATDGNGISSQTIAAGATAGPIVIRASTAALPGAVTDFTIISAQAIKDVNATGSGLAAAFTSVSNGTAQPAVDTIPVNGAIRWLNVSGSHTVFSTGAPSFIGSGTLTAAGYTVVFTSGGTYTYECGIHGPTMNGTIVVQ